MNYMLQFNYYYTTQNSEREVRKGDAKKSASFCELNYGSFTHIKH